MKQLTNQNLFDYASKFAARSEKKGHGTQYPTVRQAAKYFRTTNKAICNAVEDSNLRDANAYFGLAPAIRVPGKGNYELKNQGEWIIEAYK